MLGSGKVKLNDAINTYLTNLNIILYNALVLNIYIYLATRLDVSGQNIYGYPKYHQHQCYHGQHKNHRHIPIIQSF